jgi:anthranilate synthase component 2/putative glutamine amidotransferase
VAPGRPAAATGIPVIGVSGYLADASWSVWSQPAALVPQSYVDAVAGAGGGAVVLPVQPDGRAAGRVVALLDGLVLAGGPDVAPAEYGARPGARTGPVQPERDAWELALARAALARDLPLLGVCRGMQLLNVALGGTLRQHLPDGGHQVVPGTFVRRTVRVEPGSRLAAVLGGSAGAACHHHQAVARTGAGLRPAAWADDEVVEAVESAGHRFVVGVQWHPETDLTDLRLFRALVTACREEAAV